MKIPDKIKKGLEIYSPEEIKEIMQSKGFIYSQEQLHRSALAYIQQLEAQNAELLKKIDELEKSREFRGDLANNLKRATVEQEQEIIQLKRERDAAIHDINKARDCKTCKHINVHPSEQPCRSCGLWGKGFEWRGLCEENEGKE